MRHGTRDSVIARLGQVPLFSTCSQAELRQVARLGTPVEIPAGEVLTREGDVGREFFLIIDGKAECHVGGRSMAVFGAGDYFGELALIEGGIRTATVTATTPMHVVIFDAREFATLLRSSSNIALKLLVNLATRLRDTDSALSN